MPRGPAPPARRAAPGPAPPTARPAKRLRASSTAVAVGETARDLHGEDDALGARATTTRAPQPRHADVRPFPWGTVNRNKPSSSIAFRAPPFRRARIQVDSAAHDHPDALVRARVTWCSERFVDADVLDGLVRGTNAYATGRADRAWATRVKATPTTATEMKRYMSILLVLGLRRSSTTASVFSRRFPGSTRGRVRSARP